MKQVEIVTSKVEMLVVDLPDGATGIDVIKYWGVRNKICFRTPYVKGWERADNIDISDGNWQYTGKATELTEEDWDSIVDWNDENQYYYLYPSKEWQGDITATESGLSLLKANGVVLDNELVEKPIMGDEYYNDGGDERFEREYKEWQQAESKVWRNCHVFIKQK